MADPFVAEIRIFGFNFAPKGWAQCNGQILPISQNTALFSLIGTFYGGNGTSNFGLPNLEGRVPIHVGGQSGQGSGLSPYDLGETGGNETITLSTSQIASHNHALAASTANATTNNPSGAILAKGNWNLQGNSGAVATYTAAAPDTQMNMQAVGLEGRGSAHNNIMPSLVLNYCIAMVGVFPQRP
jgi:microcystin-dependent protein